VFGSTAEGELIAAFERYDQYVDVVSAFEWLFTSTEVANVPGTVAHFERFPRVAHGGRSLTPDFTVLFHNGTGIATEIASIATHDNSVEKVCSQIANYDRLKSLPGPNGSTRPVAQVSVLLLVPAHVGNSAVVRVHVDRRLSPSHPYKPAQPPCVVQFSRDAEKYTFQRNQHASNGAFAAGNPDHLAKYLDRDLNLKAKQWGPIKVQRAFMNDAIPPLYLATHLWLKTLPTAFGGGSQAITTSATDLTRQIQQEYGTGRSKEIWRALELLEQAGLASSGESGAWTVRHALLGKKGQREVVRIIAQRAGNPTIKAHHPGRRRQVATPGQETLF